MKSTSSLRVAIFSGSYNYVRDGVALTLNRLVQFLESNDVEVLVFAPVSENPAFQHNGELIGTPSIAIPGRPEYRLALGLDQASRKRLDAFQPSLIHVATPDGLGWSAIRYARKWNIPLVGSYHTHFTSYFKYYHARWLESAGWKMLRSFYENCERVYAPTPSMVDVLRQKKFNTDLRLWGRAVDTAMFSPRRRDMEWRRSVGFADDDCVVAFVSRLVWEKDLMTYVKAVQRVRRVHPRVKPLIVGDGPAMKGMRALMPEAVFTGFLTGIELARAYASSDIFLFPSITETFGSVTLEAAASGLPVVVADATGSRSLVLSGHDGFVVPAHDVDGFARYVEMLASDDALRMRMSRDVRQRTLLRPTADMLNMQLLNDYRDVVAQRGEMAEIRKAG